MSVPVQAFYSFLRILIVVQCSILANYVEVWGASSWVVCPIVICSLLSVFGRQDSSYWHSIHPSKRGICQWLFHIYLATAPHMYSFQGCRWPLSFDSSYLVVLKEILQMGIDVACFSVPLKFPQWFPWGHASLLVHPFNSLLSHGPSSLQYSQENVHSPFISIIPKHQIFFVLQLSHHCKEDNLQLIPLSWFVLTFFSQFYIIES